MNEIKGYKITYSIFGYIPCMSSFTYHTNVKVTDENHAIESLKADLKRNGHRLKEIIDVEVNN